MNIEPIDKKSEKDTAIYVFIQNWWKVTEEETEIRTALNHLYEVAYNQGIIDFSEKLLKTKEKI